MYTGSVIPTGAAGPVRAALDGRGGRALPGYAICDVTAGSGPTTWARPSRSAGPAGAAAVGDWGGLDQGLEQTRGDWSSRRNQTRWPADRPTQ